MKDYTDAFLTANHLPKKEEMVNYFAQMMGIPGIKPVVYYLQNLAKIDYLRKDQQEGLESLIEEKRTDTEDGNFLKDHCQDNIFALNRAEHILRRLFESTFDTDVEFGKPHLISFGKYLEIGVINRYYDRMSYTDLFGKNRFLDDDMPLCRMDLFDVPDDEDDNLAPFAGFQDGQLEFAGFWSGYIALDKIFFQKKLSIVPGVRYREMREAEDVLPVPLMPKLRD